MTAIATVADIRTAIADQLTTALGLPHDPKGKPMEIVPCGVIRRVNATARTAYGNTTPSYDFAVMYVCINTVEEASEDWLDNIVSRGTALSVFDAIEADRTLGGTCHTISDLSAGPTFEPDESQPYSAVEFFFTAYPN